MRKLLLVISILALLASVALSVEAHPGRTDGAGGHYNRSTGEYHYHHGYSEHSHYDMDGNGDADCPYNFDDQTNRNQGSGGGVKSDNNSHNYEDEKKAISAAQKTDPITFFDVLKAMLSSLLPAICIFFASSYILFYIFLAFLGENKGCSLSIISGVVVSVIAYVWLIIARLR